MTPTQFKANPKYMIGQKVTFDLTFSVTGIVLHAPDWRSDEGSYSYELTEIEVSEDPTNEDFYLDTCEIVFDGNSSIIMESDLRNGEDKLEDLPSCEFDPN